MSHLVFGFCNENAAFRETKRERTKLVDGPLKLGA